MANVTLTVNSRNFLVNGVPVPATEAVPLGSSLALVENIIDAVDASGTDATQALADAAAAQADVDAIVPGAVSSYNVAGVPDATLAGNLGRLIWVTDGNAGVACPAISDGTNWKVIALGATISDT